MTKKQMMIIGSVLVAVAVASLIGFRIYASSVAEENLNRYIAQLTHFVDVDYEDVSVGLFGMDVSISGVRISPVNDKNVYRIRDIVIKKFDDESEFPQYIDASVEGIEIDPTWMTGKMLAKDLGYHDTLLYDLNINYEYNEEKREIFVQNLEWGAANVSELKTSFILGNVSLTKERLAELYKTLPEILFYEARIQFKDNSVVERIFKLESERTKKSIDEFKTMLKQQAEEAFRKQRIELDEKSLRALEDFIDDPEEIEVVMSPDKPQPIGRLMRAKRANDLIKLLHLRIR